MAENENAVLKPLDDTKETVKVEGESDIEAIVNTEATLSESKLVAPGTGNKLSPNPHNFGFTKQVKTDTLPMSGEFNTIYIVPNGNEFLFWKWNEQHEWERVVNDSIPSLQAKKGNNVANTKVVTPQKTAFEKVFQGDVGINGDLYYQGKKLTVKDVDGKVTVDEIDSENQVAGKVIVSDGLGGAEWGDAKGGLEIIEHTGTDTIADCVNSNVPYVLKYNSEYYLARVYEQRAGQVIGYHFEFEDMTDRNRYAGNLSASDGQTTTLSSIFANANTTYYHSYALTDDIAPKYDSTATYDVGDIVSLGGSIYRCNTPITTAENFNPGNWTAIKVSEIPNIPVYSLEDVTGLNYTYTLGEVDAWHSRRIPFVYIDCLVTPVLVLAKNDVGNDLIEVEGYKVTTKDWTAIYDGSATHANFDNIFTSSTFSKLISIETMDTNPFCPEDYINRNAASWNTNLLLYDILEAGTESGYSVPLADLDLYFGAFALIGLPASYGYTGDFMVHKSNQNYDDVLILQGATITGDRMPRELFGDQNIALKFDTTLTLESDTAQYRIVMHMDYITDPLSPEASITVYKHNKTTANSVNYLTTEPSANNTDGDIKVVVLSAEPASRYDGYLYIITE